MRIIENSGESQAQAIVILDVNNHDEGVKAEYEYIEKLHGQAGVDWIIASQSLQNNGEKHFDKMEIRLQDGTTKTLYFDITAFFGNIDVNMMQTLKDTDRPPMMSKRLTQSLRRFFKTG